MSKPSESKTKTYSRIKQLRARYGDASDMFFSRKMADSGFPAPVFFGGRERFWDNDALDSWDAAMIQRGATSKPKSAPPSRAKVQS